MPDLAQRMLTLYQLLYDHFGHEPHWWPVISDTPQFEMLIGAVLVQQTHWETVEAAIWRLCDAGLLNPTAITEADTAKLAALIRPCAFHAQKAAGLQAICRYLLKYYAGDIGMLLAQDRASVRAKLLTLPRIGRESADTIMLYAGGHPILIVDAYARRLFGRLDLIPGLDFARAPYDTIQSQIELAVGSLLNAPLPTDIEVSLPCTTAQSTALNFYWNLHALIIEECIHHCLARQPRHDLPGTQRNFVDPRKCAEHCLYCQGCPLRPICSTYQIQQ